MASGTACLALWVVACGGQSTKDEPDNEGVGGSAEDPSGGNTGDTGGTGGGSGGRQGSGGDAENSGGQGSGGEAEGGTGGAQLTECVTCEPGYECFEEVSLDTCFKSCATEVPNVELHTQSDVDALAALDCEVIGNDFSVASPDISSLLGLEKLRVIKGGFLITGTTSLVTLAGLDGLAFAADHISINGNSGLTDISALSQMKTAEINLSFSGNAVLASLDGLQGAKKVLGFMATGNPKLSDVSGFSPESVFENVLFTGNAIETIVLPDLISVGGSVQVSGEQACASFLMPNIDYLGGALLVGANPELLEMNLDSLTRVGSITITENQKLTTLGGLPLLDEVDDIITITSNPSLPQCEVDEIASRHSATCTYCTGNDEEGVCP